MGDPHDEDRNAAEQVMGDDLVTRREDGAIPEGGSAGGAVDTQETPEAGGDPDAEGTGAVDTPPEEHDPEGTAP